MNRTRHWRTAVALVAFTAAFLTMIAAGTAAVTPTWDPEADELTLTADGSDSIALGCSGGKVQLNGVNLGADVPCASVFKLIVEGGPGANSIDLGAVQESSFGALELVGVYGESGNDTIVGSSSTMILSQELYGGPGDDEITGGDGFDYLSGDEGVDQLDGGPGEYDLLYGGAGADALDGGDGADQVDGGPGNDTVDGGAPSGEGGEDLYDDTLVFTGSPLDDILQPGATSIADANGSIDTFTNIDFFELRGAAGNDTLIAAPAGSTLMGGEGNDTLTGGPGPDFLEGQEGNDVANGGLGNDTLSVDEGADALNGQAGGDKYYVGFFWEPFDATAFDSGTDGTDAIFPDGCTGVVVTPTEASRGADRRVRYSGIETPPCGGVTPPSSAAHTASADSSTADSADAAATACVASTGSAASAGLTRAHGAEACGEEEGREEDHRLPQGQDEEGDESAAQEAEGREARSVQAQEG